MSDAESLLSMVRRLVAQGRPSVDNGPSDIGHGLFVGSKHSASDAANIISLGVKAVLNCAPSGVRNLPINDYMSHGVEYAFTNVYQDDPSYPILFKADGSASEHLEVALALYDRARTAGGKALFFCVAGQNRSAALAVAVLMLRGVPLASVLKVCSKTRPFILENEGFQRQLVRLETMSASQKQGLGCSSDSTPERRLERRVSRDEPTWAAVLAGSAHEVQVELLVPGLRTINARIPVPSSINSVKAALVQQVDDDLASQGDPRRVGASWAIFQTFGHDIEVSLLLEEEAVNPQVQAARLHSTFGLAVSRSEAFLSATDFNSTQPLIRWTPNSRFELVIFSTVTADAPQGPHVPFTFRHRERPGVPGTLLHNLVDPSLRAWDFVSGEPFTSLTPTVFSYSDEPRYNKRDFLEISMAEERQPLAFAEPAPDVVLGMGANAIVLRIALEASRSSSRSKSISAESEKKPPPSSAAAAADGAAAAANGAAAAADGAAAADARPPKMRRLDTAAALESVPQVSRAGVTPAVKWWDAAVKRSFSLPKMLAMIGADSEASAARRLRFAGVLNDEGRLLHFYGLGLAVASSCADRQTFHFEAVLLSQFDDRFSTYTLKRFMENYMALTENMDEGDEEETAEKARVVQLQRHFSIIHVKELLESLLDGFRDLTRAGVQSFDFNHLSNVLISRDYRKARLIDIDDHQVPGGSKELPHLAVELATLLPQLVQQLLLAKGRGRSFVTNKISEVRRAACKSDDTAKAILRELLRDAFFRELAPAEPGEPTGAAASAEAAHLDSLVEWLFAVILKRAPWTTWTDDLYDCMRCIDFMPIQ